MTFEPPTPPAALILAAGLSRRLGRPKQTLILNGISLLERAIHTAHEAALSPVVVVTNDPSWADGSQRRNTVMLPNPNAHEGMSTSVHTGIRWLEQQNVLGAVLMTCDQPALRADHLRSLYADRTRITASRYAGRNGVPAYFPAATFPALLQLTGDTGARSLLQNAPAIPNQSLALDIDTEEDLQRAQQQLGKN